MSITNEDEFSGIQAVSELVGLVLREMRAYARPGMSAQTLDEYGGSILSDYGARSAPRAAYNFPGWTCISVNNEVAHGIPSAHKIFRDGDLINVDVSAELNGFWSDNGGSFVMGEDKYHHQQLVDASKAILWQAIAAIHTGVKIAEVGRIVESEARYRGYRVIKNLTGHGVGRSLHEEPHDIANCYNRFNGRRFSSNAVVAIETFIATSSTMAYTTKDGWTLVGNKGGYVAQHEHTIMVTDQMPVILTENNGIWES
ncbi:methionine aminopeptidase, type I [Chitinophaga costaii]|uniref:Methionine aminopeptidase n=1 Tax=Chitinophaga costaii TaxID=1335309 RepID=A0A1C4C8T2_9BACT|nr:type I methionyl aminopeptidase [Chitinophaga costaii]PUZ27190.1 type I methionyl aminopeptidase [Chitinophaga costaii]SCC15403.1 methionine aminopeptidase, type I [Chitinophaga costaii]